ncbi:MAG: SufE family protein [Anaerolineae bacterium]|nr:SufE family protein [Anaerolineae bacterium]NUQ03509.1 SufE family protein [Anaerolineae bacterium]
MVQYPEKLQELVQDFGSITDRRERAEMLIEIADRFEQVRVPAQIASQPYDDSHRAPACESEAFVWAADRPDGTVKFYFDVLNPQGLSAMAMAVILDETLSGQPLEQVAALSDDVIFQVFGKEISMGKGAGLMGIFTLVRRYARERLNKN